jgi:hypothetical protein
LLDTRSHLSASHFRPQHFFEGIRMTVLLCASGGAADPGLQHCRQWIIRLLFFGKRRLLGFLKVVI